MQTAYDGQQWAAPSDVGAQGGFPASAAAAAGVHGVPDIPARLPSGEPIPIGEQLMQVDQAITLTLQEIDANFARTHQAITARILPSIKRYGVASHNTWQGAKVGACSIADQLLSPHILTFTSTRSVVAVLASVL